MNHELSSWRRNLFSRAHTFFDLFSDRNSTYDVKLLPQFRACSYNHIQANQSRSHEREIGRRGAALGQLILRSNPSHVQKSARDSDHILMFDSTIYAHFGSNLTQTSHKRNKKTSPKSPNSTQEKRNRLVGTIHHHQALHYAYSKI